MEFKHTYTKKDFREVYYMMLTRKIRVPFIRKHAKLILGLLAIVFFIAYTLSFQAVNAIFASILSFSALISFFLLLFFLFYPFIMAKKNKKNNRTIFTHIDENGICNTLEDSSESHFCSWDTLAQVLDGKNSYAFRGENGIVIFVSKNALGAQLPDVTLIINKHIASGNISTYY